MAGRPVAQSEDERVAAADQELARIHTEISQSQALLEEQGRSHAARKEEFAMEEERMANELADRKRAHEEELSQLGASSKDLKDEYQSLSTKHGNLLSEHVGLENDVEALKKDKEMRRQDVENLVGQESAAQARVDALKTEEETLTKSISDSTEKLSVLNGQLDSVSLDLSEKEGRVALLTGKIKQLEEDMQRPMQTTKETEARLEALRAEEDVLKSQIPALQKEVSDIKETLDLERGAFAKRESDLNARTSALALLETRVDAKIEAFKKSQGIDLAKELAVEKGLE